MCIVFFCMYMKYLSIMSQLLNTSMSCADIVRDCETAIFYKIHSLIHIMFTNRLTWKAYLMFRCFTYPVFHLFDVPPV